MSGDLAADRGILVQSSAKTEKGHDFSPVCSSDIAHCNIISDSFAGFGGFSPKCSHASA
jgi:hypothetical protein